MSGTALLTCGDQKRVGKSTISGWMYPNTRGHITCKHLNQENHQHPVRCPHWLKWHQNHRLPTFKLLNRLLTPHLLFSLFLAFITSLSLSLSLLCGFGKFWCQCVLFLCAFLSFTFLSSSFSFPLLSVCKFYLRDLRVKLIWDSIKELYNNGA